MTRARVACLALALLTGPPAHSTEPVDCPGIPVLVSSDDIQEAAAVCETAASALRFLADCGLTPAHPISIHMVEQLGAPSPAVALASFDSESGRIDILRFEQGRPLLTDSKMFRIETDESLYLSLVAHEVAHGIARQQPAAEHLSRAMHEYLAYVTQLATLPAATRERVLARFSQGAFEHREEITEQLWSMDPEVFAIKAYRHFHQPGRGCLFLDELLGGQP
jgi:hypothetical protein